jgi:hypothetical protein
MAQAWSRWDHSGVICDAWGFGSACLHAANPAYVMCYIVSGVMRKPGFQSAPTAGTGHNGRLLGRDHMFDSMTLKGDYG